MKGVFRPVGENRRSRFEFDCVYAVFLWFVWTVCQEFLKYKKSFPLNFTIQLHTYQWDENLHMTYYIELNLQIQNMFVLPNFSQAKILGKTKRMHNQHFTSINLLLLYYLAISLLLFLNSRFNPFYPS